MDKQIDDSERISPAYVRKILKCKCGANKRPCVKGYNGSDLDSGFMCECSPDTVRLPFIMHFIPPNKDWGRLQAFLTSGQSKIYENKLKEVLTNEPGDTSAKGFIKFSYSGLS